MENKTVSDSEVSLLELDVLAGCSGLPIQFAVSYKEALCVGNLDDGEIYDLKENGQKFFSYRLLNVLMKKGSAPVSDNFLFILSSNEGRDVLIPFEYRVIPHCSLRRSCQTLINRIEYFIVDGGLKVLPRPSNVSAFYDGAECVVPNDYYTFEDAARMQGLKLSGCGCKYERDKHIITGDIGNLANGLIFLFR